METVSAAPSRVVLGYHDGTVRSFTDEFDVATSYDPTFDGASRAEVTILVEDRPSRILETMTIVAAGTRYRYDVTRVEETDDGIVVYATR